MAICCITKFQLLFINSKMLDTARVENSYPTTKSGASQAQQPYQRKLSHLWGSQSDIFLF